ncbi:MAG: hypothetical protein E7427_05215 [Ruminococcaceae bacterium]|nr:hypothetical protein [Oscillospiraceae bacterium]
MTRIGLYAAYVFLMLSVLRIASHAGDGFLSVQQQEMVYYVLQIFVILGFFAYAFVRERHRIHMERGLCIGILAAFFVCVTAMLFGKSSPVYMATAFLAATCLGYLGGAVYERMSEFAGAGGRVAAVGSVGYAAGIALQYLLQFWHGRSRLLPAAMLLAFCLLAWRLSGKAERPTEAAEAPARRDAPPRRTLLFACLIAAIMLLFLQFYNSYIQHLQIISGYVEYNVYTWPRLMMIPCLLLFALLGDRREGRYVPLAALCIALAALLNAVLVGSAGAYRLNMCLFYAALAATVSYYNLVFWRLAPGTKRPALWAGMGRVIDSASVLLGALLRIGTLPSAAVMAVNVAGLAALIVLMAVNGDFVFAASEAPAAPAPDAETRFAAMASRYGLTPKETALLRELVLTEDKQTVIGERMDLKVKTIQKYVTQIYRKTGATTRSGLTELYHNTMAGI